MTSEATGIRPRQLPAILIVEDDPGVQHVLKLIAGEYSGDVTLVADGQSALEAFRARRYDTVIFDLHLPGLGGLELTHWLKSEQPECRVLVVSGFLEPTIVDELKRIEVTAIAKPFRPFQIRGFLAGK